MKTNDEERGTGDAEREAGIGRVVAHARVPRMVASIEIVQPLQLRPECALEGFLAPVSGLAKRRDKRRENTFEPEAPGPSSVRSPRRTSREGQTEDWRRCATFRANSPHLLE